MSMFTGLLPSEHGAHFQSMGYRGESPTLAELARAQGYETEVVTRNSLFDGTVPGSTRGFDRLTRPLAPLPSRGRLFHLVLALSKPRVRRLLRRSGFFTTDQLGRRDFLETVARMGIPNDRAVLEYAVERLRRARRDNRPCFLFLNCYDVHAPYSPSETSPMQPWTSAAGLVENLRLALALPKVSGHGYLRPGFRLSKANGDMLRRRYETAISLMDAKLASFWDALARNGLLEHTVVALTSDHGEAFGEHELYFHDASVYGVHLHVPLWIHHPEHAPEVIDDVVGTRDLFPLLASIVQNRTGAATLLDADHRGAHPLALAEHFHYPHVADALPRFRHNQAAAIGARWKISVRGGAAELHRLGEDPAERSAQPVRQTEFEEFLRSEALPPALVSTALRHLERWHC